VGLALIHMNFGYSNSPGLISIKISSNYYDGLTDQENTCKTCGVAWSWSSRITIWCAKQSSCGQTIVVFQYKYAKQSSMKLFRVTQLDDESTWTYLKMFNKEMLKMKEFFKPLTSKALIIGVRKSALLRELYTLLNRSLLKVK
jgi:hypothetical protein